MQNEPLTVTLQVIAALDELSIPYVIGGSLASTLHGVMRTTVDSDLIAEIGPEHIGSIVHRLNSDFYVSAEAIANAIVHQSSFNLIHLQSLFKVDVFISRDRAFDKAQMADRTAYPVTNDPTRYAFVASAEDTILAKLEWYRMGGEVSERQWRDVVGIVRVQADRLNWSYIHRMATDLDVADLARSLQELANG